MTMLAMRSPFRAWVKGVSCAKTVCFRRVTRLRRPPVYNRENQLPNSTGNAMSTEYPSFDTQRTCQTSRVAE